MANLWLDLKGPILADTVYIGSTRNAACHSRDR